jgi:energy-converting hydrogenase B subunit D
VSGAFGLLLAVLFLSFHAPDVALSQIVVGSFVIPTLVLVTLSRSSGGRE